MQRCSEQVDQRALAVGQAHRDGLDPVTAVGPARRLPGLKRQHLVDRPAPQPGGRAADDALRRRVGIADAPFGVDRDHAVVDRVQRDLGAFLLFLQRAFDGLQATDVDVQADELAQRAVVVADRHHRSLDPGRAAIGPGAGHLAAPGRGFGGDQRQVAVGLGLQGPSFVPPDEGRAVEAADLLEAFVHVGHRAVGFELDHGDGLVGGPLVLHQRMRQRVDALAKAVAQPAGGQVDLFQHPSHFGRCVGTDVGLDAEAAGLDLLHEVAQVVQVGHPARQQPARQQQADAQAGGGSGQCLQGGRPQVVGQVVGVEDQAQHRNVLRADRHRVPDLGQPLSQPAPQHGRCARHRAVGGACAGPGTARAAEADLRERRSFDRRVQRACDGDLVTRQRGRRDRQRSQLGHHRTGVTGLFDAAVHVAVHEDRQATDQHGAERRREQQEDTAQQRLRQEPDSPRDGPELLWSPRHQPLSAASGPG